MNATAGAGMSGDTGYAVESLTWHPVDIDLPDADITVLYWIEPMGERRS
jgi:hypothetical protein